MTFKNLVAIILDYVSIFSTILVTVLVLVFIFKIVQGISKSDSSEGRKQLRQAAIFGVIGVFFAVSFIAIARLIATDLGIR